MPCHPPHTTTDEELRRERRGGLNSRRLPIRPRRPTAAPPLPRSFPRLIPGVKLLEPWSESQKVLAWQRILEQYSLGRIVDRFRAPERWPAYLRAHLGPVAKPWERKRRQAAWIDEKFRGVEVGARRDILLAADIFISRFHTSRLISRVKMAVKNADGSKREADDEMSAEDSDEDSSDSESESRPLNRLEGEEERGRGRSFRYALSKALRKSSPQIRKAVLRDYGYSHDTFHEACRRDRGGGFYRRSQGLLDELCRQINQSSSPQTMRDEVHHEGVDEKTQCPVDCQQPTLDEDLVPSHASSTMAVHNGIEGHLTGKPDLAKLERSLEQLVKLASRAPNTASPVNVTQDGETIVIPRQIRRILNHEPGDYAEVGNADAPPEYTVIAPRPLRSTSQPLQPRPQHGEALAPPAYMRRLQAVVDRGQTPRLDMVHELEGTIPYRYAMPRGVHDTEVRFPFEVIEPEAPGEVLRRVAVSCTYY